MKRKTILFGIDGAPWHLVDRFVEEGAMPNMKKFLQGGVKATLLSTFPTETMAAWTSIFTGVNPGKHGMPDFRMRLNGKIEIAQSRFRQAETIWQIMSKRGMKSILINDPVTYPPNAINGVVTTGLMTPPNVKNFIYPADLREEIDNVVGGYMCEPPSTFYEKAIKAKPEAYAMLEEVASKQAESALYYSKKIDWDVLAPIFTTSDRLMHVFYNDYDYLKKHFALLDGYLGKFLEIAQNENANVLIASDHGFGPIEKALYINTWLANEGFQIVKKSAMRSMMTSSGLTVYKLMEIIGKLRLSGLALKIYRISPKMVKEAIPLGSYEEGQTDYDNSQAFSTAYHGIYINSNLKGQEFERVRDAIMAKLYEVTDNGTKIVEKLYKREEVLWGAQSERAPDIFIVTKIGYGVSTHLNRKMFDKLQNHGVIISGSHRLEGIFAAAGPDIKKGLALGRDLNGWDVASTILHMHSVPIPSHMDGKVIKEIFADDSEFAARGITQEVSSESLRIKERLKALKREGAPRERSA
ncbi:MAG TPA: alkaline phosphatase family protein [Nitrososphaera sp.]|nr:alkaline phosphatase family protein [Nitrososphaera sp.]